MRIATILILHLLLQVIDAGAREAHDALPILDRHDLAQSPKVDDHRRPVGSLVARNRRACERCVRPLWHDSHIGGDAELEHLHCLAQRAWRDKCNRCTLSDARALLRVVALHVAGADDGRQLVRQGLLRICGGRGVATSPQLVRGELHLPEAHVLVPDRDARNNADSTCGSQCAETVALAELSLPTCRRIHDLTGRNATTQR
mmetsp:Transcript_31791/g.91600  ORF Transcript_31791/g.91600 Transcript_31791/m.91600 type:complete len:202 (+) Transcript_31791:1512-2117(+)